LLKKNLFEDTQIPHFDENSTLLEADYEQNELLLQRSQAYFSLENEREFQDSIIHEREEEIKLIHNQMKEVNFIFKDIANMVHEQGEMINSIQTNITSSKINVDNAVEDVVEASNVQKKSRKLLCLIAVISTVVLVVTVVIVILVIMGKNKNFVS